MSITIKNALLPFLMLAIPLGAYARPAADFPSADFPSHAVRIIVPFAPGGPTDVTGRIIADLLSSRWKGQGVVVENRPGAGTILGTAALAKAAPDGYTIGLAITAFLINPAIGQRLPYDTFKDFVGITSIGANPIALTANPSFPPNTVPELVAYAKAQKEPLNFTSPGARGAAHLAGEWLAELAGIKMQHISYNGSAPALVDEMAGRVPMMFDPWHSSRPHFLDGKLKLIAAAGAQRLKDQPQVPSIAETYPGFDVSAFQFIIAPAGIPLPVLDKLTADIRAVIDSPEFAERAATMGIEPQSMSRADLEVRIRKEIATWAKVAKEANIKAEE